MSEHAQLYPTTTYKKDGVTYVPHYRNSSIYVGPGYPQHNKNRYTEQELVAVGATKDVAMLWSRSQHGIVTDINP